MKRFAKLAAVAAFMMMPVSAMAATVTQAFNSTALAPAFGNQGTEWTTPDGFITVSSTGGPVYIGSNTLGVAGSSAVVNLRQQLNIGETLRFTFASLVTDVVFGRAGGPFPVKLTSFDENGDTVFSASSSYPYSIPSSTVVNGPDNLPILSFLLEGVFGSSAGISSITYTTVDIPAPAPVPLPAAGFLLLGGMGALYGIRRKKSAANMN